MEIVYFILNYLIDNGGIFGYIQKNELIVPLSYSIGVFAANAAGTIDLRVLSKNFYDLDANGKKILTFIYKNKRSPEREEAWKLGVPFDDINTVINYINTPIKTSIYEKLTQNEKEYFDSLSVQVISYLQKLKDEPSLEILVSELELGVKDAKLIIPFINEVLQQF